MIPSWQHYGTYDESAHPDLWDGVVGYWAPCLGPTGLRLHDVSRYNNWGTLTNMDAATDWVVSDGRYALDFDGSNDYVLTQTFRLKNAVTISAWIKRNNNGNHIIVSKGNTLNNFVLFCSNGLVLRGGDGTFTAVTGTYSTTNTWSHVVGTIQGTTGTVYAEGRRLASGTVGAVGDTETYLDFGRYFSTEFGQGYFFNGQMSDIVIHNKALSANEISQLYQLGRGGMLQRRSRRRGYVQQAGFRAHYATQRNAQLIGGGLK